VADPSPLAGLLDRAGRVISLAGQLARAFTDEYDRQGSGLRTVDPTAWGRQQPAFNVFCNALLELRDEMQNPPDGFEPVAEVLMNAARVAKQIRDVMQTTDGQTWQSFLDFRFHFNSIVAKGGKAIRTVTKARRLDDPFAFVEQPAARPAAGIDTTPTVPRPPAAHIEEAIRAIPDVLANVPPKQDGTIELVAAHLAKRLQDAKHSLAAAHWSIHAAVQADRLHAELVAVELPSIGVPSGSWGGPAHHWHGGGRGTKAIPKGKPAPFDCFKVVATEALWEWWRSLDVAGPAELVAQTTYDPCDREPRTYAELVRWMVYWADFRNPHRTGLCPPTIAHSEDHQYLECYCQEMFEGFDLDTLGRLRSRYIAHTSKTVAQIDATPLREIADHFRKQTCQPGAQPPNVNTSPAPTTTSATGSMETVPAKKSKRSTERGEGRTKLIGALTKHHKYADGSCLNLEPIGNNDLAKAADVSPSTASAFFNNEFRGHTKYKALCRDAGRLAAALKLLNNEFSPHNLYGGRPADEGDEGNLK
jgi:hypothetical protein